ncbi:MAG: glycosyltransferase, partial [Bacteroidetes bacterium]|nr:glycosyltransferase [Bacteroidota bacterium]
MPKLSIITVNLNNLLGLQKTMQSVLEQTFTDYEYIIIDGGSTDGSKEYIAQHSNKLAYWVSEKDKGIYNAMNKGIKQSKGKYLLFLNSGDFFIRESVLSNLFSNKIDTDLVYCDVLWCEGDKVWKGDFPSKLTLKYFVNASLPHQATLIKRELFNLVGLYDETIKISSDWKFFVLAIYMYKCTYSKID